jgi:hypothetical protein
MNSLETPEMLNEIKRSELIHMAYKMKIDPNDYIAQIVRTYPEIEIINDLSYKESIF